MSLVWRKIQRSNKKAAKFRFIAQFQELSIQCSKKWQPSKVAVAWVHRRRRYITKVRNVQYMLINLSKYSIAPFSYFLPTFIVYLNFVYFRDVFLPTLNNFFYSIKWFAPRNFVTRLLLYLFLNLNFIV